MSDNGGDSEPDENENDYEEEQEEELTLGDEFIIEEENGYSGITFDKYETNILTQTLTAKKKTIPFLTKYEKAKIIGLRAQQIARGAPLYIDRSMITNPIQLAERELMERKIPFIIRRRLPNDQFEDWKLNELIILDDGRTKKEFK